MLIECLRWAVVLRSIERKISRATPNDSVVSCFLSLFVLLSESWPHCWTLLAAGCEYIKRTPSRWHSITKGWIQSDEIDSITCTRTMCVETQLLLSRQHAQGAPYHPFILFILWQSPINSSVYKRNVARHSPYRERVSPTHILKNSRRRLARYSLTRKREGSNIKCRWWTYQSNSALLPEG